MMAYRISMLLFNLLTLVSLFVIYEQTKENKATILFNRGILENYITTHPK